MSDARAHLHAIRAEELEAVRRLLPAPPLRIVEIGGGDGYQALLLSASGYDVESLDIHPPNPATSLFDVRIYDEQKLPFAADEFDCVFSSNVLEHVRDLETMNAEIRRVLKPGGIAVHVLPSTGWRFWTSVAHYGYSVKFLLSGRHSIPSSESLPVAGEVLRRRRLLRRIARALFPPPHGEYASSLTELYAFGTGRWMRVFRRCGFDVIEMRPLGIFYTGYGLLAGALSITARRGLARVLSSSSNVFVLRDARKQASSIRSEPARALLAATPGA